MVEHCFNWNSEMTSHFKTEEDCPPLDIKKGVDFECDKEWHKVKLGFCIPRPTPADKKRGDIWARVPHPFGHCYDSRDGGSWPVKLGPKGGYGYGAWPPKGDETEMGQPKDAPVYIRAEAGATVPYRGGDASVKKTDEEGNRVYLSWPELRARLFHEAMMDDPATVEHIKKMKDAIRCKPQTCKKEFKKVKDESPNLWQNDDIFIYDQLLDDTQNAGSVTGFGYPIGLHSVVGVCLIVKVRCSPPQVRVPTGGEDDKTPSTPAVESPLENWWRLSEEDLAALLKRLDLEWMTIGALKALWPRPTEDAGDSGAGGQKQIRWPEESQLSSLDLGSSSVVQGRLLGAEPDYGTGEVHRVLDVASWCACPRGELLRASATVVGHAALSSNERSRWLHGWSGKADLFSDCCNLALSDVSSL